ncbi:hypothetical protein Ancab_020491 [Ancistrocladus abbreviatus]
MFFATMEASSVQNLCKQLIALAIQRCRFSDGLSRLSVVIKRSLVSDLPLTYISISDTGIGCCLEEFRDLKYAQNRSPVETWDGVLSITTTGIDDCEIYHYKLNLKERVSSKRLTRLPSAGKNSAKFSGTEVSLSASVDMDVLLAEITCFFRKMLILKTYNIAIDLVAEFGDCPGSQHESVILMKEPSSSPYPSSTNIENMKSGLEDYLHKHKNELKENCQSCFARRENLKVGKGMACREEDKGDGLVAEAVIMISELSEPSNPSCPRRYSYETEVLYFKDFSPCHIHQSTLDAMKSINWNSYGLILRSIRDHYGSALLEGFIPPARQRGQHERKIIKQSIRLALDDLKENHRGALLSANAVKISSYAPDLAKSIAGLILSSDDHTFQEECFSLLGLQPESIGRDIVENCITGKIVSAIAMDDRRPTRCSLAAPSLFQEDCLQQPDCQRDEYGDGEECCSFMDI